MIAAGKTERRRLRDLTCADVRRHDDDRVAEVDCAPLRVGQAPLLENLQQDVEHIGMRLLDLIEQHDRVRLLAHRLRELAALVEADVARGRTDQTAHAVLLHVLGHIEAQQRVLGVEQKLGERLGKLGLAHARGAQEDKAACRALRVLQACAAATYRLRKRRHGLVLADDSLVQHAFHAQKLLSFGLSQVGHRHACGHGNHVGDILHRDLGDLLGSIFLPLLLGLLALGFKLALLVAQLGCGLEILRTDGLVLLGANLAQLIVQIAQLLGQRHVADAHARASLVDDVDRLVGQEAILDVAVGHLHGRLERLVGEMHLMVRLVTIAQAAQDADGLLLVGLADGDGLEAALERGVLLEVLAVLIDGRGADDLDLAARQRRLQDGRSVDGALGRARADERVHLVDEQDDVARVLHLFDALLQAILELAAILAARHERGHVKREQALVAQQVGHLVRDDELREPFHDGGLAHTRLADEQRVVLLAAREHLHDALNLARTADDRVELAVGCLLGKVGAELLEHAVGRRPHRVECAAAGINGALPHQVVQGAADVVALHVQAAEHVERRTLALAHDAQKQMLGRDVGLPHLHGLAQGVLEHALHARGEGEVAGHVGALIDRDDLTDGLHHRIVLDIQTLERLGGEALLFLNQPEQDMLGAHIGLVKTAGLVLRQHEHLARLVGELVK